MHIHVYCSCHVLFALSSNIADETHVFLRAVCYSSRRQLLLRLPMKTVWFSNHNVPVTPTTSLISASTHQTAPITKCSYCPAVVDFTHEVQVSCKHNDSHTHEGAGCWEASGTDECCCFQFLSCFFNATSLDKMPLLLTELPRRVRTKTCLPEQIKKKNSTMG